MSNIDSFRLFAIVVTASGLAAVFCWALAQLIRFIAAARDQKRLDTEMRRSLRAPRTPHIYLRDASKTRPAQRGPYASRDDDEMGGAA